MNVRALPTCRKPVGEGAKRTRGVEPETNDSWGIVKEEFLFDAKSAALTTIPGCHYRG